MPKKKRGEETNDCLQYMTQTTDYIKNWPKQTPLPTMEIPDTADTRRVIHIKNWMITHERWKEDELYRV